MSKDVETDLVEEIIEAPAPKGSNLEIARKVHAEINKIMADDKRNLPNLLNPKDEWEYVNQGLLSEKDLMNIYAKFCDIPQLDEEELDNIMLYDGLSYEYLSAMMIVPLSWEENTIKIMISDPYNTGKIGIDWQFNQEIKPVFVLARRSVVERYLNKLYENVDDSNWGDSSSEETLQNLAKEAPIVRLVNDTFTRALDLGASDIHIEALEDEFVIRLRIDGMLQNINTLPISMFAAVTSRVKLIGGMNIAEHRLPQDGRTELQIGKSQIDVRISTVPSSNGESLVLRILEKDTADFDLKKIGMSQTLETDFRRSITLPHGIVLVVGPTGSGKSTTLYCVMNIINTGDNKILTVEDPVEYQLPGVTQVQVKQNIGLTFASSLRAFLRQDPDVILVGEIRDKETAEIAINAALTGHLVLSTLHTNDAAGSISRLQDMGVENFLISSSLAGVLSQRLVRKVCSKCKGIGLDPTNTERKRCRNCGGSGYRGRVGIFEFMDVNGKIRKAINDNCDSNEIAAIAKANGMITLKEDGQIKAKHGLTTLEEVSRVCQLDTI